MKAQRRHAFAAVNAIYIVAICPFTVFAGLADGFRRKFVFCSTLLSFFSFHLKVPSRDSNSERHGINYNIRKYTTNYHSERIFLSRIPLLINRRLKDNANKTLKSHF